jgi:hypothetical protein
LAELPPAQTAPFWAALTLISPFARAQNISFDVSDISFDALYIIFALIEVNRQG